MAQLLQGRINLSKIPKDLIRYNNAGEAFVWIDITERREPGQYGDTHNVSIYDSANRQKIYIGDLRPREFGETSAPAAGNRPSAFPPAAPAAPAPEPAPRPMNNAKAEYEPTPIDPDLPF